MKYTVSPNGYYYKVNSKGHKTRISRLEYTKRNKNGIGGGFFGKNKKSNSKKSNSKKSNSKKSNSEENKNQIVKNRIVERKS